VIQNFKLILIEHHNHLPASLFSSFGSADKGPNFTTVVNVSLGGQGASPGDVAMANRIYRVAAFTEDPARALITVPPCRAPILVDRAVAPGEDLVRKAECDVINEFGFLERGRSGNRRAAGAGVRDPGKNGRNGKE